MSSHDTNVVLTENELRSAVSVATSRRLLAMREQQKHRAGKSIATWDEEIEAACAELAAAKALGLYWTGSADMKTPDLNPPFGEIEVRWTDRANGSLIVRGTETARAFVLVTGRMGHYRILGCISGQRARDPRWLTNKGNRRPPAWFVPKDELSTIDELREYIETHEIHSN